MMWDVESLGGLDRSDAHGLVHFEVHRWDVHSVPVIKVFFKNLFIFLKCVFPKFCTMSARFAEFFFFQCLGKYFLSLRI